MAAALAVTDEVALPIRAVGDLAAAAEVSREEVAVITQCAALGELATFAPRLALSSFSSSSYARSSAMKGEFVRACVDAGTRHFVLFFFCLLACMHASISEPSGVVSSNGLIFLQSNLE
jgi:hypothetical protein